MMLNSIVTASLCPRPLSDDASDVRRLSGAYIGPKSTTERPRKTKIGTEVAHITRDSDTTFKVRTSKVNLFDGQKRHSLRRCAHILLYFAKFALL